MNKRTEIEVTLLSALGWQYYPPENRLGLGYWVNRDRPGEQLSAEDVAAAFNCDQAGVLAYEGAMNSEAGF